MKKRILLFVFMSSSFNVYAQNIIPDISARIDTTQVVINKIYHLYIAYLNSKPDSVYANPCWNESEYKYYLQTDHLRIDRSANVMFYDEDAASFYKEYKPMILQIDSIGINKYQIKTIFPLKKSGYTPKIISEGLATWLGGPGSGQSFEEVLKDVSMILHQCDNLSFEGIKDGSIRNRLDSNILYITGAVICKLAYEAKGKTAVWGLYNSTDGTLNSVMENIFEQPINDVGQMIIEYILRQTTK